MRPSGINYNKASEMDKLLVNSVCLVLFTSTVFTNDASIYNNMARNREGNLEEMSRNLTAIPMSTSGNINFLNLAYNQISNLEDHVFANANYRQVKKVYLFQNIITNVSVHAFKGLKQLKVLDLSDNNITSLDPYTFKTNAKLDNLILMNNIIAFDRLQTFLISHSLQTLILTNNQITQIYSATFLGVPNLKRLILTGNPLNTLDPISFKSQVTLRYLSLSNTGVRRLTIHMFQKLPKYVHLENTPLSKRFEPPLRQIADESVRTLVELDDSYF